MDYKPDWSEDTINRVEDLLEPEDIVFEWGTGYSTIWLAYRCKKVITMEHNPEWRDRIKAIADDLGLDNIEFHLCGLESLEYYTEIANNKDARLIIIDGRNRVRCFENARLACKQGGIIMLDDSQREKYQEVFNYGYNRSDTMPKEEGVDKGQKASLLYV